MIRLTPENSGFSSLACGATAAISDLDGMKPVFTGHEFDRELLRAIASAIQIEIDVRLARRFNRMDTFQEPIK